MQTAKVVAAVNAVAQHQDEWHELNVCEAARVVEDARVAVVCAHAAGPRQEQPKQHSLSLVYVFALAMAKAKEIAFVFVWVLAKEFDFASLVVVLAVVLAVVASDCVHLFVSAPALESLSALFPLFLSWPVAHAVAQPLCALARVGAVLRLAFASLRLRAAASSLLSSEKTATKKTERKEINDKLKISWTNSIAQLKRKKVW